MPGRTVVENGIVQTLCRQCDMHCGIDVHIRAGRITKISGNPKHPQNWGRCCAKSVSAIDLVYHPDRLLTPLKRSGGGDFYEISYEQALDEIATKVQHLVKKTGASSMGTWAGESIGFFQQEEYARRFIGALGSSSYFCAGSVCSVSRNMAQRFVQGYYSACPDFGHAGTIFLWGANPGITHPVYMWRIQAARRRGARLVVIDPRRTEAACQADVFVQLRPGTDGALAWGLCRRLIHDDAFDHLFVEKQTVGFEAFAEYADRFTTAYVARQTGLNPKDIATLADLLEQHRPRIINYPGISLEHQTNGSHTIRAIACLSGLCGAVDAKGGETWLSPFSHRSLLLDDQTLPAPGADRYPLPHEFFKLGHSMTGMDYILGQGRHPLRGLIVTGANPVLTNPNTGKVSAALASLDLLVVRDLFMTATARMAHYILPAASFMERSELHYYNHLPLVALSRKVLTVPDARSEYSFWHDLAFRLGLGERYFPWPDEDEVNRWILSAGNIRLETLQSHPEGVLYAPMEYGKHHHRPLDTPSGKFEFVSAYLAEQGHAALPEYVPPAYLDARDDKYPFTLITGARKACFYHSRIIDFRKYRRDAPQPECEIHPEDASRLGIRENEPIRVESAFGAIQVVARVVASTDILPGVLQIAHGWDSANVNRLTDDRDNDPVSGFPNMKMVSVQVVKPDEH